MHTNTGIKKTLEEIIQMTPEEICSDREIFDSLIYTDIDTAVKEIHRRKLDQELKKKVEKFFGSIEIPKPLQDETKLLIARPIATPNYEMSRFLIISDGLGIKPVFFEYNEDIFFSGNSDKKFLGKLPFHKGFGANQTPIIEYKNIIDFNLSNGKQINTIQTIFDNNLVDLHHELFVNNYPNIDKNIFFNASDWFHNAGPNPRDYYKYLLSLGLCHTIILENFVLNKNGEDNFIKEVVIDSLKKVYNYFGIKPLIVALEPTEIEGEIFWECHNLKTKSYLENLYQKNGNI